MRNPGTKIRETTAKLENILKRRGLPDTPALQLILKNATNVLLNEKLRPAARNGKPGGLVKLKSGGYFIIVPDLHGRMDFFNCVMNWRGFSGRRVIDDMSEGFAQVICVGDAFHSESRGRERWKKAMQEWIGGYKKHKYIDQEMRENLGLIEMIALVKTVLPESFHFLKGNHENIANEQAAGNFPFRKFAYEGEMVKLWTEMFLGNEGFDTIYRWEKALPILAEGADFLISHSEPCTPVTRDEVINAYENTDVIYSLTWTANDQAEQGSVPASLQNFGKPDSYSRVFGGHRVVSGMYSARQDGRYIQINRPDKWIIAAFTDMQVFNPDRDIICLTEGDNCGKNS